MTPTTTPIRTTLTVGLYADDPISRRGIDSALGERGIDLIARDGRGETVGEETADVALVVVQEVDEAAAQLVRRLRRNGVGGVVMIVATIDDHGLLAAVEAGVTGLLPRSEASGDRMAAVLREAARGAGSLPADLLGRLMEQVSHLQDRILGPRGMHLHGLTDREVEVLRLVAEGHVTAEIAQQLCYSERTIKNVIQGVTSRLQLRNRSHAVAYALRNGLI